MSARRIAPPRRHRRLRRNLVIGLIAFLTVVDLFATQAILPSLARAYGVSAGRDGLRRQRQHDRHGGGRAGGRLLQPPHRPPRAASSLSLALLADPDRAARRRARPRHLHRPARRARPLHGGGVHADPGLSRRALQRRRRRRRARRLRHRQCRQQPVRPAAVGRASPTISASPPTSTSSPLLNLAGAVLVWFWLGRTPPMTAQAPRTGSPLATWARASAQRAAARAASPSASASCSPSSAPSPTSTSCWSREPLAVSPMALGFVYFVFLPSIFTTPLAGRVGRAASAPGRPSGARSASPAPACRCC